MRGSSRSDSGGPLSGCGVMSGEGLSVTAARPLEGMRILDMTSVMLGPYATQMLGDYGADVIKVEAPSGDTTRRTGPTPEAGMAATFVGANRNKRSIVLDLKTAPGRDALLDLAEGADVLVTSVRPQKMAVLGLSPDTLRARNGRLVVVAAFGFAEDGPYAGRPAYDDIIQSLCGLSALTEAQGGAPSHLPTVLADKTCSLFATQAILMALLARTRTGQGAYVELPMFEAMVGFTLVEHLYGHHFDPPIGEPGYGRVLSPWRRPYRTADGYICLLPYTDEHWRCFFEEIGRPGLARDERFAGIAARTRNIDALYEVLGEHVASRTTARWLETCERLDIPAAPLNRLRDLEHDPHLRRTGFFRRVHDPLMGDLTMPAPAIRFDGATGAVQRPPRLGEHTTEVLQGAGFEPDRIAELLRSGAAVQWRPPS